MGKSLGAILALLIPLCNISYSQEIKTEEKPDPKYVSILKEEPSYVIEEIIDRGDIKKRDALSVVSAVDEDAQRDRTRYREGSLLENIFKATNDRLEEDPLFYAWDKYEDGFYVGFNEERDDDLSIKNQLLGGIIDASVAKYSFARMAENATIQIKEAITLNRKVGQYRIKVAPNLSPNTNALGAKIKIEDKKHGILDGVQVKLQEDKIGIAKAYPLQRLGDRATFELGGRFKYDGESWFTATLKFPLGFRE